MFPFAHIHLTVSGTLAEHVCRGEGMCPRPPRESSLVWNHEKYRQLPRAEVSRRISHSTDLHCRLSRALSLNYNWPYLGMWGCWYWGANAQRLAGYYWISCPRSQQLFSAWSLGDRWPLPGPDPGPSLGHPSPRAPYTVNCVLCCPTLQLSGTFSPACFHGSLNDAVSVCAPPEPLLSKSFSWRNKLKSEFCKYRSVMYIKAQTEHQMMDIENWTCRNWVEGNIAVKEWELWARGWGLSKHVGMRWGSPRIWNEFHLE